MRNKTSTGLGKAVPDRIPLRPHALGQVRIVPAMIAGLSGALFCAQVSAMGLGSASSNSRIGGPLRIEIPILAEDSERVEPSCLRLVNAPPGYNEELPWLNKARISIEKRGNTRLLVISSPNNNHPALMLGIQIGCGMELRRDYTLLLNPPANEEAVQLPALAPAVHSLPSYDTAPSKSTPAANKLTTLADDTARSIANRLYPGDTYAQRRMARALLAENAEILKGRQGTYDKLPAGVELLVPPLPAKLPERLNTPDAQPAPRESAPAATPVNTPTARTAARKGKDRLFVSAGGTDNSLQLSTAISQRKELNEDQRSRLRTEMQLIATLDEKIATQLELADRLRQLEALQSRLKEDADRLEAELRAQQSQQQSTTLAAPLSIPVAVTTSPDPEKTSKAQQTSPWYENHAVLAAASLGLISLLGAGAWIWRRRRGTDRGDDTLPLPDGGLDGSIGEHLIDPLSEADIWPDEEGHAPRANPRAAASMEGALGMLSVSGLGPASMLQILDDDVEEHDSAVELADIMMSFGRVQGAAQTLADFIRANPKQAVKPWIKLLEVYRAADMQVEYDALTTQLNKTFNVRTVAWEEFEVARQAPESLESMPHIMARLNENWGRRECQVFLHELLRDNRQGTRQGFPLAVIDEILLLLGILESQIGPFRPEATEQASTTPSHSLNLSTASGTLSIPPIMTEPATEPLHAADKAPGLQQTPSFSSSSISQLDFELDMTDLSKTLHLNLDELETGGPQEVPRRD